MYKSTNSEGWDRLNLGPDQPCPPSLSLVTMCNTYFLLHLPQFLEAAEELAYRLVLHFVVNNRKPD